MTRVKPRLDRCAKSHGFNGAIELRLHLKRSGEVRQVTVDGAPKPVRRCVERTVSRRRFEREYRRDRPYTFRLHLGPVVLAKLSKSDLIRVIGRLKPRFDRCARKHGFKGIIKLTNVIITKAGRVRTVTPTGGPAVLRSCIRRIFVSAQFPLAKRDEPRFNYPLAFRATDATTAAPSKPAVNPTTEANAASVPVRRTPTVNDRDADGIANRVDQCPDQAEDLDNFEDSDGCPDPDNDQDRILDVDDQCPGVDGEYLPSSQEVYNGYRDEDGCPE